MIDFYRDKRYKGSLVILVLTCILLLAFLIPNIGSKGSEPQLEFLESDSKTSFSISTGTKEATEIGSQILREGGNAIDAAISVSFALGVSSPQNSGIGGGGVILVLDTNTNEAYYYDFYNASGLNNTSKQIGVPGFLKGMKTVYEDYGTLPLEHLLDYPIQLAEQGFIVDEHLAHSINLKPFVGEINDAFLNNDKRIKEGDLLVQEELAKTYKEIQTHGLDVLYDGQHELSKNFSRLSNIDSESLAYYEAHKYNALRTNYNGREIISAGSPFSGSTLIEMLKLYELKNYPFSETVSSNSIREFESIYNYAFNNNYMYVSDSDESRADSHTVIEDYYIETHYNNEEIYVEDFDESENTISYSIIDDQGYVVIGTNTLSNHWGSLISSDGYFFNNSLKNFTTNTINEWAPLKRPKTFISPVIVTDDQHIIGVGASGGNTIPQIISMIVGMENRGIPLEEAVNTQRFAIDKDRFVAEHSETRTYSKIDENDKSLDFHYYNKGVFFSAITGVSYDYETYDSYYETTNCSSECAQSSN